MRSALTAAAAAALTACGGGDPPAQAEHAAALQAQKAAGAIPAGNPDVVTLTAPVQWDANGKMKGELILWGWGPSPTPKPPSCTVPGAPPPPGMCPDVN